MVPYLVIVIYVDFIAKSWNQKYDDSMDYMVLLYILPYNLDQGAAVGDHTSSHAYRGSIPISGVDKTITKRAHSVEHTKLRISYIIQIKNRLS